MQQQIARDKAERKARPQNEVQKRQCAQAASPSPSPLAKWLLEFLGIKV